MIAFPKPRPRKRVQASNRRTEAKIKRQVRAACVQRDGHCRVFRDTGIIWTSLATKGFLMCDGPSEWAHLVGRYKTRRMDPEVRHNTQDSLMLCSFHHGEHHAKRLAIIALSERGADGPLRFERLS